MNWAALEKQSTMVIITVLPANGIKPVMKGKEMCDHGQPSVDSG